MLDTFLTIALLACLDQLEIWLSGVNKKTPLGYIFDIHKKVLRLEVTFLNFGNWVPIDTFTLWNGLKVLARIADWQQFLCLFHYTSREQEIREV